MDVRRVIYVVAVFVLLLGCTDSRVKELIVWGEPVVNDYPDSVRCALSSIGVEDISNKKDKADFALLYTEALFKCMKDVKSDSLIRIAWEYYADKEDVLKLAKTNLYMGEVYCRADSVQLATQYLVRAEQFALECENNNLLGLISGELGGLYLKQRMLPKALEYFKNAKSYFIRAADTLNVNYTMASIARCYWLDNKLDTALSRYQTLRGWAKKRNDSYAVNYLNGDLIPICMRLGRMNEAKCLVEEVYAVDSNEIARFFDFADICYFEARYDSAKYYLRQILQDNTEQLKLKQRIGVYIRLRTIGEKTGNFEEAYRYSLTYEDLSDSLRQSFADNNVLQMEKKYKNELLTAQNDILRSSNYNKKITLVALVLGIVILIYMFFFINSRKKRIIREKQACINEYIAFIDALNEEHEVSKNDLMAKLNEKNEKEGQLKRALVKRFEIIKQLIDLSARYGNSKEMKDVFIKKVKGLMNVNALTQESLSDLLEIVDINYGGIVDFLRQNYALSKVDLELCCFVSSGFTPQEIGVLYNCEPGYVSVRYTRLKNRMRLNTSLPVFIKKTIRNLQEQ